MAIYVFVPGLCSGLLSGDRALYIVNEKEARLF